MLRVLFFDFWLGVFLFGLIIWGINSVERDRLLTLLVYDFLIICLYEFLKYKVRFIYFGNFSV